jgi:hypothetical protein
MAKLREQILELHGQGYSKRQICIMLKGVRYQHVHRILTTGLGHLIEPSTEELEGMDDTRTYHTCPECGTEFMDD